MGVLSNLEPASVFYYFEEICSIPHTSHHEKALSDYCVQFAKAHGLACRQDEMGNVLIKAPATPGYEKEPGLILQGHLDMVCEKADGSDHDFKTDPLGLMIEDDWITADGTTLGGDDGIAVAYGLALLDNNTLPHPKLYVIFTTEEEVGMEGAHAIDLTPVSDAAYMINLDSEDEGIILAGCAGGVRANCTFDIRRTARSGLSCELAVSGLHGGHSGQEINRYGANASVLLGTLLNDLSQDLSFDIIDLTGGTKDNVITKKATATIVIDPNDEQAVTDRLKALEVLYKKNYASKDPELTLSLKTLEKGDFMVFNEASAERAIFVLMQIPNGVQAMSLDIEGLVETSLNLGIMYTKEDYFLVSFAMRSSIGTAKEALSARVRAFTEYLGGTYTEASSYPAWEYRRESALRDMMCKTFEEMYGKTPTVEAIHAGLECGLISAKLPELDIVSIGPDMQDIHTPEERLSISSTARTWDYLVKVLENLK